MESLGGGNAKTCCDLHLTVMADFVETLILTAVDGPVNGTSPSNASNNLMIGSVRRIEFLALRAL